nr:reverse transcriptase domain-containing protein [Tanacetum cinerariifolium]
MTLITAPLPFYKWGIDIAGPFPEGPRKVKFLIVAMDYFTNWIEAKAVATITGSQAIFGRHRLSSLSPDSNPRKSGAISSINTKALLHKRAYSF